MQSHDEGDSHDDLHQQGDDIGDEPGELRSQGRLVRLRRVADVGDVERQETCHHYC